MNVSFILEGVMWILLASLILLLSASFLSLSPRSLKQTSPILAGTGSSNLRTNQSSALPASANQRPRGLIPRVSLDLLGELLGELDLGPDVLPQPLRPVDPHHEPELEGAEPAAQGNVPVPVVRNLTLVLVLEVQRVNIEGIHNLSEERNIL